MAGNPLIDQGTLNRVRSTLTIPNFPQLNVTAAYLGKEGISASPDGVGTTFINTMTGAVTSPEPYQLFTIGVHLLRSQGLAALWRAQFELLSTIGPIVIRSDSVTDPLRQYYNCGIEQEGPFSFNGEDPKFGVTLKGYYLINSSLWNDS